MTMSGGETSYSIRTARPSDFPAVLTLVEALLAELGEEGDEAGALDRDRLVKAWGELGEAHVALLAEASDGIIVGIMTLAESFALYANGPYGVINEMIVAPDHRSSGVGAALIAAAIRHGRSRSWRRIDVTAPESPRWARTRRFYEKQGFHFTGPKLKLLLTDPPDAGHGAG